ncbi:Heat-labile enterotoxin IIA, A chain [Beauveria brongniartii RCEF 3172]|uniref:Heat-labile enterotoxin IIA, A chain n=1 Tax=Beauveria brongniartii RCEF 3172 TaxID=1081107 RepID=A0A162JNJ3_9HYPO|nr:Heat-labile enterotoxin IIA, A chain [Beauveria brongniartii RCEF 3172]
MKITTLTFALLRLCSAHVTLIGREPQAPAPPGPGELIGGAVKDGIKDWGPAGSLKPPASPKPPIRNMPGSISPYHKPQDPNIQTGVTRIPGSPLGPAKKCRPCLKKRDICCDSTGKPTKDTKPPKTPPKTPGKTPSNTPTKHRLVYKPSRFAVPKSAGKAAVFMLVAPYAHNALDAIKRWDNPIGRAVSWFDNAMASLQEAIGGPQRTDIYGNELKYKMTKAIGSALQLGFETTWDKRERLAKEAAAKEAARRAEEEKENQRIKGLEELAQICEKTGSQQGPGDAQLKTQITQSCQRLETAVKKVQAQEEARKRKSVKPEPIYWFGKCRNL